MTIQIPLHSKKWNWENHPRALATNVILPSTSLYSSLMAMVLKKEDDWHMCLDFHALHKLTIKDKLYILFIDYLLDELHGDSFFTNWILHQTTPKSIWKMPTFLKLLFAPTKAIMSFWSYLLDTIILPLLSKASWIKFFTHIFSLLSLSSSMIYWFIVKIGRFIFNM